MSNKWAYFNILLCAQYKSIIYQLDRNLEGYPALDKIETELKEQRASQTLNDWLELNSKHLRLFVADAQHDTWVKHERRRTASPEILLWAEVLESYLKFKHDTPSCVQLWRWAKHDHREQKQTERQLAHLNIRMVEKVMYLGNEGYCTTKKAFDKLFERHIHTQSIDPDAERRKSEKFYQSIHKKILGNIKNNN